MKSILIIGLGRFGRHMAQKFLEGGHEVMAIDYNEERADDAVGDIQQILIGDATEERFMETLGIRNFDLAVIAIGENFQTVLEITVLLKDLGCKYIVARATRDVHKKLLLRNGADYVSYAEREVAERLAIKFGADTIFDYVELTPEEFTDKMNGFAARLDELFSESRRMEDEIKEQLKRVKYE